MDVTLRKAQIEDSEMLLSWRNEITTIPWMATQRILSFKEHDDWFKKTLATSNSLFFIIEVNHEPGGQIRYLLDSHYFDKAAKVSINLTHRIQGKGIASLAFKKGSALVRKLGFAQKIFAHVRSDNIASIKAMTSAGFLPGDFIEIHGAKHLIMIDGEEKR